MATRRSEIGAPMGQAASGRAVAAGRIFRLRAIPADTITNNVSVEKRFYRFMKQ